MTTKAQQDRARDREMKRFLADRRKALLSLNKATIYAYLRKYGEDPRPSSDEVFWTGIHKARTAAKDLPMQARSDSKYWLALRGMQSLDDGDVPWSPDA